MDVQNLFVYNSYSRIKGANNKIVTPKVAEDLTTYCLRHTFATDLQKAGVPINVAKELMGHEDISVTANTYTHKDTNLLHQYFDAIDAGVGNPVGNQKIEPQK